MNAPTTQYQVSRRTLVVTALAGGVTPRLLAGGLASAQEATALSTPLNDQLTWLLATINEGANTLTVEDVNEHFAASFLEALPAEQVVGFIQQASMFAPLSFAGFTRAPTDHQVNSLVASGAGIALVVPVSIEEASPHLITGFNLAPVPPPSGVDIEPFVNPAGTPVAGGERQDALVDIGGRNVYISSMGVGAPTVVLESGANDSAAPWFAIEQAVASFARVVSYDRANSVAGASDPAPKPRTGLDVVADLHETLSAAGETGPYVLVGHSIGGIFVRLYASSYPDEVAGLVLIDSSHEDQETRLQELLTPEQLAFYEQMMISIEGLDLSASFEQMQEAAAATPLPELPLAVVSAGIHGDPAMFPPGWPVEEEAAMWAELQEELASLAPGSHHVVAEESSHYIHQSQPDLVVEAIRSVVMAVRDPATWATPAPHAATPVS